MVSEDPISDNDLDGFIRNLSDMTELKLNLDSLCIAGYPTNCSNSNRNDCEDLYHSLRYSYNYHMDDCDEIMTLALADVHTCQFSMTLMKLTKMSFMVE